MFKYCQMIAFSIILLTLNFVNFIHNVPSGMFGNQLYQARFTKIQCKVSDTNKIVENHYCYIKNYNRNISSLSLGLQLKKEVNKFYVENKLYFKFLNNYRLIWAMPKVEGCNMILNYKTNIFLNVPVTQLNEAFPGLIHKCPYKGFTVNNITTSLGEKKDIYPPGNYRTQTTFSIGDSDNEHWEIIIDVLNFSPYKEAF